MQFRLELTVKPLAHQVNIRQPVALLGSCFTDHIGSRLRSMKFRVLENPYGILFNPISMERVVQACISRRQYTRADLFQHQELWTSWDFHGQFSHPDLDTCLAGMNAAVEEAHQFLQQADWLVLTLGSAFVYELRNGDLGGTAGDVVANCHKVPASHFAHRLASLEEIRRSLQRLVTAMRAFNPGIRILFTISPVRHHREGIVENNRSKATLHLAVMELMASFQDVFYFPAYELVIDDLRDYRFYAEDLVHPNYAATQYVWEKFILACVDDESRALMQPLEQIRTAMKHRPLHPNTSQHRQFLDSMLQKVNQLQQQYTWLDLEAERAYFSGSAG